MTTEHRFHANLNKRPVIGFVFLTGTIKLNLLNDQSMSLDNGHNDNAPISVLKTASLTKHTVKGLRATY